MPCTACTPHQRAHAPTLVLAKSSSFANLRRTGRRAACAGRTGVDTLPAETPNILNGKRSCFVAKENAMLK